MGGTDADSGLVKAHHDWSETEPSFAIINAIAAIENVESTRVSETLDISLYEVIDPEALDSLLTNRSTVSVTFNVDEYTVEIDGNELVLSRACEIQ